MFVKKKSFHKQQRWSMTHSFLQYSIHLALLRAFCLHINLIVARSVPTSIYFERIDRKWYNFDCAWTAQSRTRRRFREGGRERERGGLGGMEAEGLGWDPDGPLWRGSRHSVGSRAARCGTADWRRASSGDAAAPRGSAATWGRWSEDSRPVREATDANSEWSD